MHKDGQEIAQRANAFAAELFPGLSQQEQTEAVTNLRRYFEIALAIAEENAQIDFGLTQSESVPTVKERSQGNLKS